MIQLNIKTRDQGDGPELSRRQAIQWVMAAVAASALPTRGDQNNPAAPDPKKTPLSIAKGYGGDPVLTKIYAPGEIWPLTLNDVQKKCATALCDVLIPADDLGPAASAVNVPAMLDDWVSAPYPAQQLDRGTILKVLAWVDAESQKRFGKVFAEASPDQQKLICDDICFEPKAKSEFKEAAGGFDRLRSVVASAYYATPEGWKAVGYVGNVALEKFEGPPAEVLEKLGVTQTVA